MTEGRGYAAVPSRMPLGTLVIGQLHVELNPLCNCISIVTDSRRVRTPLTRLKRNTFFGCASHPSDLAWFDGTADWVPLSSVPSVTGSSLRLSSRQEPDAIESLRAEEPDRQACSNKNSYSACCVSGLFSLVCLLTTLLLVSGSPQKGFPSATLLGGLLLTVTDFRARPTAHCTTQRASVRGLCALHKRKPTISAGLNRHIGAR